MPPIPLLIIAGPTATGKTEMAVRVAEAVGGEIVSADSMQIYRHMEIGTAKPTPDQLARARFHLVDIVEPDEPYNVALFQRDAVATIKDIYSRGLLPILCGGTGLYVRAVTEGFVFPPATPAESRAVRRRLQEELAALGNEAMHRRLEQVDPEAAAQITVADSKRIVRALEVYELAGAPISELQRVDEHVAAQYNRNSFALTCPRPLLYRRIEARIDEMMAAGWLEEVRGLRERGYDLTMPAFQALGYRHLLAWLETDGDLAAVVELIKRDTRRFAKRQLTWLRRERDIIWLEWETPAQFEAAYSTILATAATLLHGGRAVGRS